MVEETLHSNSSGNLTGRYGIAAGTYDELLGPDGAVRPHWTQYMHWLEELGPEELGRRWLQSRQMLHDNGVTYNVYGDPRGIDRPWTLDPIPLLVDASSWQTLEEGLKQRALLLEMILADCYGPQKLLSEGLLPPELIYAHPNYLRPCRGVRPSGGRWLHFYAADFGRAPDGSFQVLSDRTQAPSGMGYALENRIVLSRSEPEIFRDCGVQRMAHFFRCFRETLSALAPGQKDNPVVVLLTPGPYTESYFEHAYLSRYLGYTLVEAGDLIVRDQRVFLKTLAGLEPVDVILRRPKDELCDPVELRADANLGVPGLVQAVYSGGVAVANPLGSGLTESPALLPLLPKICRRLLDQDLRIQAVQTYWCGETESRRFVLEHLRSMVIKPSLTNGAPVFCDKLSDHELADLAASIETTPIQFVGQSQLALSSCPVFADGVLEPRHLGLRAQLVASGDSYVVMPGGLARFSQSVDTLVVSMSQGGGSKDVWVLSNGPVDTFSLLPPLGEQLEINRSGDDLPSRVADNLFWLGRYVERAEGRARLLRSILLRTTDQYALDSGPELPALLYIALGESAAANAPVQFSLDFRGSILDDKRIHALLFDESRRGGLQNSLVAAHRLGAVLRDRLSIDTWRIINGLVGEHSWADSFQNGHEVNDVLPGLDQLIVSFAAFSGLVGDSMTRGNAWRFIDIGRRLERAVNVLRLLRGAAQNTSTSEGPFLEAILEAADSSMTYRRRYLTILQLSAVLDLLLLDESNPRSVAFQLAALDEHIRQLPRLADGPYRSPEEQVVLRCLTGIRLADVHVAAAPDASGLRPRLVDLLAVVTEHMETLSDAISRSYLSHAEATTIQLHSLPPVSST
jgi:uncharacterized circularly permuted ATP-grasp superfamily protein/uncharacterized alpha-E superfamily protein